MDIVIIGSGNVAHVLGRLALQAGHVVRQVVGRDRLEVDALAEILHAGSCILQPATANQAGIDQSATLYLVCISDDALYTLHQWFRHDKAIVAHTAGAVSRNVLAPVAKNHGVLWPLQSIRKEAGPIPPMPLVVDASSPECLTVLQDFAASMSPLVHVMDDGMRSRMHLAAVMAGNFSNQLFAMVYDYCRAEGLDPALLVPLLQETVQRMSYAHPRDMQTGPAIRGDQATMDKHLSMLKDHPALIDLYRRFSALIQTKQPR